MKVSPSGESIAEQLVKAPTAMLRWLMAAAAKTIGVDIRTAFIDVLSSTSQTSQLWTKHEDKATVDVRVD